MPPAARASRNSRALANVGVRALGRKWDSDRIRTSQSVLRFVDGGFFGTSSTSTRHLIDLLGCSFVPYSTYNCSDPFEVRAIRERKETESCSVSGFGNQPPARGSCSSDGLGQVRERLSRDFLRLCLLSDRAGVTEFTQFIPFGISSSVVSKTANAPCNGRSILLMSSTTLLIV